MTCVHFLLGITINGFGADPFPITVIALKNRPLARSEKHRVHCGSLPKTHSLPQLKSMVAPSRFSSLQNNVHLRALRMLQTHKP